MRHAIVGDHLTSCARWASESDRESLVRKFILDETFRDRQPPGLGGARARGYQHRVGRSRQALGEYLHACAELFADALGRSHG